MPMFVLLAATFAAVYWFWIRPVLKSRSAFRERYEREESFFAALREKLAGIKQKLSSVIVIAASVAVSGYDFLAPIAGAVDTNSIAAQTPSWAWPLILISVTALFQFLRSLAVKRRIFARKPSPTQNSCASGSPNRKSTRSSASARSSTLLMLDWSASVAV